MPEVKTAKTFGDPEIDAAMTDEERRKWQIKYASGIGQQVYADSAEEVREIAAQMFGADYEIASITELK